MIVKGIWYPEIAESTQGSFVTTCQFSTKNCNRPAMGRWLASTEERPKLLKTTLLLERLSSLLLVTYLYLSGLRLLLETLGWNRVLTWLSSREFPPAPAPASQCNMSFSLWLESLVGDLTIFQETDPLALA